MRGGPPHTHKNNNKKADHFKQADCIHELSVLQPHQLIGYIPTPSILGVLISIYWETKTCKSHRLFENLTGIYSSYILCFLIHCNWLNKQTNKNKTPMTPYSGAEKAVQMNLFKVSSSCFGLDCSQILL